jgi:hypothetical protein
MQFKAIFLTVLLPTLVAGDACINWAINCPDSFNQFAADMNTGVRLSRLAIRNPFCNCSDSNQYVLRITMQL